MDNLAFMLGAIVPLILYSKTENIAISWGLGTVLAIGIRILILAITGV